MIIQKNERGRQGRERYIHNYMSYKIPKKKEKDDDDKTSILLIQRGFRAYLARERVNKLRDEELEFLGMIYTKNNDDLDNTKQREDNRKVKKLIQLE